MRVQVVHEEKEGLAVHLFAKRTKVRLKVFYIATVVLNFEVD